MHAAIIPPWMMMMMMMIFYYDKDDVDDEAVIETELKAFLLHYSYHYSNKSYHTIK